MQLSSHTMILHIAFLAFGHFSQYGLSIELSDNYPSIRYSGSGGWQIDRVSTIPSSRLQQKQPSYDDYDSLLLQQTDYTKSASGGRRKSNNGKVLLQKDYMKKRKSLLHRLKNEGRSIHSKRGSSGSKDGNLFSRSSSRKHSTVNTFGGQKHFQEDINSPRISIYDQEQLPHHIVTETPLDIIEGRTWENIPLYDLSKVPSTKDPSIPENPEGLTNPDLLIGPWEEETPDVRNTKAYFHGVNESSVTAQVGTTANISCIVLNRGDHETVSWIRLRDHHLITVGRQTYSNDERFTVSYNKHSNEWILHLRFVQPRDAGRYVCQLSTHPPMVFIKTLSITEASATIEGGPERIVEGGSVVKLKCSLEHHSQAPEYVFWYHNKTMINFATNRQVQVENTRDGSILTLMSVSLRDSGNYTCVPAKAHHASVMLHVILDDAPAAMQVSSAFSPSMEHLVCILNILFLISILL